MFVFLLCLLWEDFCRYIAALTEQSTARNLSHTITIKPFHSFTFVYITEKSYGVLIIECQRIWGPHTQTHTWQTTLIGKHTSIRPRTGGKVHSPCAPPCLQVGAAVKGWNCKTNDWILRTGLDGSLIKKTQKTWDANKESTPNCHMPVYTV